MLPNDVVFSILDQLPDYAKSWHRGLSQATAKHLRPYRVMLAKQPDLPLWLLQQHYADLCGSGATDKDLLQQQAQLLSARAAAGDLAGVEQLRRGGCAWSSHSCTAAAEAGHLHVLRWLLSQRPACPIDAGMCALAAASAGQLHVLQFLRDEVLLRPFDLAACAEAAAAAGQQAVMEWLVAQDGALAATAALSADQAVAAAARQQVRQIMRFASTRTSPAIMLRA